MRLRSARYNMGYGCRRARQMCDPAVDEPASFVHHGAMQRERVRALLDLPEMDAQHDYLYELFDALIAIEPSTGEAMRILLDEIGGYLDFHITSEEHLIRFYRAPGFAVHQADHEQAARMFLGYVDEFERGDLNPRTLHNALTGWLTEHCTTVDRQYADHIRTVRRERGRGEGGNRSDA